MACVLSVANVAAANPILDFWEYIPDGEPYVFEDPDQPGKYRVYVYGSHDTFLTRYCGRDQVVWSAPVEEPNNWRYDGVIFESIVGTSAGDTLYAPDVCETIDKETGKKVYYLYPNNQAGNRQSMVARSDRPDGPFEVVNWANANRNSTTGILGFDPAVFVDDDGRVYGYWGFETSYAGELDPDTMYSLKPGTSRIDRMIPGTQSGGGNISTDPQGFNFFEASSLRKVGNKYVFVYARRGIAGERYGTVSCLLAYAYSDTPLGPWTYGGVIIDNSKELGASSNSNIAHNNHGSICEINGQWYIFYHRCTNNHGYSRQACVEAITVQADEKPVSEGGKVVISEVAPTSMGFEINGLDPYQRQSAGIACYQTGSGYVVANRDKEVNNNTFGNITNNTVAGYKTFDFGSATPDGKARYLSMEVEPGARGGTVTVYADRPNAAQGTAIAAFTVAPGGEPAKLNATSDALNGLEGKHDIFFAFTPNAGSGSMCTFSYFQFGIADPGAITGLGMELDSDKIDINGKTGLSIVAYGIDGSAVDVGAEAAVTAEPAGIVSIADGTITGVAYGQAYIKASYGGYEAVKLITVKDIVAEQTVEKLVVSEADLTMDIGQTRGFTVTAVYKDGHSEDVTAVAACTNPNNYAISVANGIISAKAQGRSAIRFSYAGALGGPAEAVINVLVVRDGGPGEDGVAGIVASLGKNVIAVGEKTELKVMAADMYGVMTDVTAAASIVPENPEVAAYAGGFVSGAADGIAYIDVAYKGFSERLTVAVGNIMGDNFIAGKKNSTWSIVNEDPANWGLVKSKGLWLPTLTGDLGSSNFKNVIVQPAVGDWSIVAKVFFPAMPSENYQQAALLVWQDGNNFVKLDCERTGGNTRVQIGRSINGSFGGTTQSGNLSAAPDGSLTVHYRLTKAGNTYRAAYSLNGINYTNIGSGITLALNEPKIGLFATKNQAAAAVIDTYIEYVAVTSLNGITLLTDAQVMQNAVDAVAGYVSEDVPSAVAGDFALSPVPHGYTVSAVSGNQGVISDTGEVTRPATGFVAVPYTITVSDGTRVAEKTVMITVVGRDAAGFDSYADGGKAVSLYYNDTEKEVKGVFYLAVYDARGALVHVEAKSLAAGANGLAVAKFDAELSEYAGYDIKAFAWDEGFIPLADAITY